ncbi:MAG: magnesium transporter CorA family protein [Gammaproteobacteria bacterium]|nr:magnesium transporter CorA family protein [Gammaproteobacteria bacterium]
MQVYHFLPEQAPQALPALEALPDAGFVWLDLSRDQAAGFEQQVERLTGARIDIQHIEDAMSASHVSFFDGTDDYDMVIFESLGPKDEPMLLETRSSALFVFDRLLVTVHAADAASFEAISRSCEAGGKRPPRSAVGLAYRILDAMIDRFLALRDAMARRVESLQDAMLHARAGGRADWRELMRARRSIRRLARLAEDQWETVEGWRRGGRLDWDEVMNVRLRDLLEHITRIRDLAAYLERDLDTALQLNFAVMSQRQNEIMKVFTVMAVVFMPLTLLTGVWGMNFEFMPELHWRYGYPLALALIVAVGVGMFLWFKRRRFF